MKHSSRKTFKPSNLVLVNMVNPSDYLESVSNVWGNLWPSRKILIAWNPIEMAGFCLRNCKCDRTF